MTAFEVSRNDRSVLFGSCGIPQIQLHIFVIDFDCFHFKIHCCDNSILVGQKLALDISPKQSCLSHIHITHDDNFIAWVFFIFSETIHILNCAPAIMKIILIRNVNDQILDQAYNKMECSFCHAYLDTA